MKFTSFSTKEMESFANNTRQRVKRLVAKLATGSNAATTTRDNTVLPISLYEANVADDRPVDCDRGHMIALEFGGPEDSENLVPMYGGFNSGGDWRNFERELDSYAGTKKSTAGTIEVEIVCTYSTESKDDARIPTGFTITAKADGANAAEKTWNINHPRPKPTVSDVDKKTYDLYIAARNAMNLAGWLIENQLGDMSSWPSYRKKPVFTKVANVNASHIERPYGFLDYMDWLTVKDTKSALEIWQNNIVLSATSEFKADQIKAILSANRVLHEGSLLSDDPQDVAYTTLKYRVIGFPAGTLVVGGRDLAPEVDHIIPQSMTGCAAYSNAQVLSGKHNNSKRAEVTAIQSIQLSSVKRGTGRMKKDKKADEAREALIAKMKEMTQKKQHSLIDSKLGTSVIEDAVTELAGKMTYGLSPTTLKFKARDVLKALNIY